MYAIYGNIYHQHTSNVSIYTSTMDPMANSCRSDVCCEDQVIELQTSKTSKSPRICQCVAGLFVMNGSQTSNLTKPFMIYIRYWILHLGEHLLINYWVLDQPMWQHLGSSRSNLNPFSEFFRRLAEEVAAKNVLHDDEDRCLEMGSTTGKCTINGCKKKHQFIHIGGWWLLY